MNIIIRFHKWKVYVLNFKTSIISAIRLTFNKLFLSHNLSQGLISILS